MKPVKDDLDLPINEFRIKVTVRNNLLLSAIEAAGYKTQSEFARACELNKNYVHALVSMRKAPIMKNGEFSKTAKVIMEVLGSCPSDLWTDSQLTMRLKMNTGQTTMDAVMVQELLEYHIETMTLPNPEYAAISNQLTATVNKVLSNLTSQEEKVLRSRFGIGIKSDHTLEEVAPTFDITKERVRQIESKALRKLRHPSNSDVLDPTMELHGRTII